MVTSQYTSKFSKSINGSFYWFKKVLFQKLKERLKEFLLSDFDIKLIGISEKDNVFFVGEEYFVTRIRVDRQNEVFFRISSPLMNIFLENSIGKKEGNFVPEQMTELEAKILTSLNDFIYKGLSPFLVKDGVDDEDEINDNLVHLTFIAQGKNKEYGKLILSLPIALLPEVRPFAPEQSFDMDSFPDYKVPVKIITGKSEITLYDVQHIESGDIVVLEQSNIKKMIIDVYGSRREFLINPETSIITGVDDSGGDSMENMNNNTGTMWDVIPVEITAEFESVTISLGELKQISEGVIVDVGSIYENKVFLKVENKPVASGELIIINDKYAVRVDEVFTDKPTAQQNQAPTPTPQQKRPQPAAAPQQNQQPAANNDDFNYDNFDIEDEDI